MKCIAYFFFNDTATTEIYTLSLHDALPIYAWWIQRVRTILELVDIGRLDHFRGFAQYYAIPAEAPNAIQGAWLQDRKSTRLNSSHANISYAVFCLKKKNTT